MINNNISNVADIFALKTLGMMLGSNQTTDYSKLGETLKRAVTSKCSDNDIEELAIVLNLPAEKVQEAVNAIIKQLKTNQIS